MFLQQAFGPRYSRLIAEEYIALTGNGPQRQAKLLLQHRHEQPPCAGAANIVLGATPRKSGGRTCSVMSMSKRPPMPVRFSTARSKPMKLPIDDGEHAQSSLDPT